MTPKQIQALPEDARIKISEALAKKRDEAAFQALKGAEAMKQNPVALQESNLGRVVAASQKAVPGIDELVDLGTSAIRAISPDVSFKQAWMQERAKGEAALGELEKDYPTSTVGGMLGGALLSGGAVSSIAKGGQIGGNILRNPLLKEGTMLSRAGKTIRDSLTGMAAGFGYGALDAPEGERTKEGSASALLGGVIGGAGTAGVGLAKGAIEKSKNMVPNVGDYMVDLAKKAKNLDIPLRIDDIDKSSTRQTLQKIGNKMPFNLSDEFIEEQRKAFTKKLMMTAGATDDAATATRANVGKLYSELGDQFDDFTKDKIFSIDFVKFTKNLAGDLDEAEYLYTEDAFNKYKRGIDEITDAFTGGKISGDKLARLRSKFSNLKNKAKVEETIEVFSDLEARLIDIIENSDEATKKGFSELKRKYKNFIAAEPLLIKAKDGAVNPTQLQTRISRVYGRNYYKDIGEIGDLAEVGYQLLRQPGGSDTFEKLAFGITTPFAPINQMLQRHSMNPETISRVIKKSEAPLLQFKGSNPAISPIISGQAGGVLNAN